MCRRESLSLFLCRLVSLVARVPRCQLRDTCVLFASSACVRKETSSLNTQNTWSANRLTRTNTIVGSDFANPAPFTGYLDKRVPQRILCNALLAPGGAENANCRTHRAPLCPRANYCRCFLFLCERSQATELVCRDVEATKRKSMSCCMREPTETAQSLGDDTHAPLARPQLVREQRLRTECGPLRWWVAWPIHKCSKKDVGKRERETHTPTPSLQEKAKRLIMRKRKSNNNGEQKEDVSFRG